MILFYQEKEMSEILTNCYTRKILSTIIIQLGENIALPDIIVYDMLSGVHGWWQCWGSVARMWRNDGQLVIE